MSWKQRQKNAINRVKLISSLESSTRLGLKFGIQPKRMQRLIRGDLEMKFGEFVAFKGYGMKNAFEEQEDIVKQLEEAYPESSFRKMASIVGIPHQTWYRIASGQREMMLSDYLKVKDRLANKMRRRLL